MPEKISQDRVDKNSMFQPEKKTEFLPGTDEGCAENGAENHAENHADIHPEADVDKTDSPHALDGSQYLNIIEEQAYSEQPPTPEEQKPWRIFHQHDRPDEAPTTHEAPTISVGPR